MLLLISVPVLLALIVTYLTRNPTFQYETKTIVYTGIASGYTIEQKERFDLFASNNAFDNLINVIKSRETMGETSIRLFAQALSLETYVNTIISKESFIELRKKTPQYIKDMVVKPVFSEDSIAKAMAFEQTVQQFLDYANASDTNYIYNLLNYKHPHYSYKAISGIKVKRVQSSDLIEISYENNDPGITMQTIKILTAVFIRNYKSLKENQSDAVVKYFQEQVSLAQRRLKNAETDLLNFNEGNQIINYYEQSKFIAEKKGNIEEAIQLERMKLAGAEQALQNLENKLQTQGQVQGISDDIIVKRNRLVKITEKVTINELYNESDTSSKNEISRLKVEGERLRNEINHDLGQLYSFTNSIDGFPIETLLSEWLTNLIKYAEAKAGLEVLLVRENDFIKDYEKFAPLGANMSRIEREISVAEREYLSLLNSLNEAKLKQQNEQLTTNIKPLDQPYFPINPIPSKRKIIVVAAGMFGFILVAFSVLLTEYFDNSLKNMERAERLIELKSMGIMPKIISKYRIYNMPFITNRLVELMVQKIKLSTSTEEHAGLRSQSKLIVIFGTGDKEGKSFLTSKLVDKLRAIGDRVLYLNYTFLSDEEILDQSQKKVRGNSFMAMLFKPFSFLSSKQQTEKIILQETVNEDNFNYKIDDSFSEKRDLFDLVGDANINSFDNFRYVFLELPSILSNFYPNDIVSHADMNILVVRSNREWKVADAKSLEMFAQGTKQKPMILLNGVEIEEIESILGTLPKKRSKIRVAMKQLAKFQFYTKSSIK